MCRWIHVYSLLRCFLSQHTHLSQRKGQSSFFNVNSEHHVSSNTTKQTCQDARFFFFRACSGPHSHPCCVLFLQHLPYMEAEVAECLFFFLNLASRRSLKQLWKKNIFRKPASHCICKILGILNKMHPLTH